MRLFVVLNEQEPRTHVDVYDALDKLVGNGDIGDYKVYPFVFRLHSGAKNREVVDEITGTIHAYEPELVLFSHTGQLDIEYDTLRKLRVQHPTTVFAYRDGDIYHPFYKPMPREIFGILSNCSVSFWCGYDLYAKKTERFCKDRRYVPLSTDPVRFSRNRGGDEKEFDVVMIGNLSRSKIPFKSFPGGAERVKLAMSMHKLLGDKFAVFGKGWKGMDFCRGPVAFGEQGTMYGRARIALGNNNLHASYYFSDRLPIALGSGVLMAHNYEEGIESPFADIGYNLFFKDVQQARQLVRNLLETSQDEIDKTALRYSTFSLQKLTMEFCMKYMVDVMKSCYFSNSRTNIPAEITNPWLGGIMLTPYTNQ